MIEINEVVRRSNQGVSQPFICKDTKENKLWVKGAAWSVTDLVSEWVCACLAQAVELPVAEYDLVSVEKELVKFSSLPEIASLGSGIGFGSFHVAGSAEFDYANIETVDFELRADILLFDYWIHNGDRILGIQGGNPNMLWVVNDEKLVIIDHNMAFDKEFSFLDFIKNHAFGESIVLWNSAFRKSRHKKLLAILEQLPNIINSIPEDWFIDDYLRQNSLVAEIEHINLILRRVETDPDEFWEVCI